MKHRPRKRFGQNFLHDPGIISKIVQTINPGRKDHLVEIGPGQGAITGELLPLSGKLDVIELDRDLVSLLERKFDQHEHFALHSGDALMFDFCQLQESGPPLRVVGNLPYNISTPLLFHLLASSHCISDMHFMLQKEVVDRMAAHPGNKTYGRLSVMLQVQCQVTALFDIGPGAFIPPPKVTSAFVRLVPYTTPPHPVSDMALFSTIVTQAFSQRRKTLGNTLKKRVTPEVFQRAAIDPGLRAEQLSPGGFVSLANIVGQIQ